jgi:argininosuccinate lyase
MGRREAWGGRFGGGTDRFVEEFTASIGYDSLLYRQDIAAASPTPGCSGGRGSSRRRTPTGS